MEDFVSTEATRVCDLLVGDIATYNNPERPDLTMTFEVKRLWPTKAAGLVCFETTDGQVIQCSAAVEVEKIVFADA